ncbi:hypothetical protein Tco_0904195 [Tanacetum coccineum]
MVEWKLVDAILLKASAFLLSPLGTCLMVNLSKPWISDLVLSRYRIMLSSLATYSPNTWLATKRESTFASSGGRGVAAVVEARGDEWVRGSDRSGDGEYFWIRPEKFSDGDSSGGRRLAGNGERGREDGESKLRNGLEAFDGEINLAFDENLISNEFAVKLCLDYEFIINLEEDDFEPRVILGRSFLRLAQGVVDFGNGVITIYPEPDPFEDDSENTGKSSDDWDQLLDFNF